MLNSQRLSDQKRKKKKRNRIQKPESMFVLIKIESVGGAKEYEYDDVFSKVSGVMGEKSLRVVEFEVRTNEKET